VNTQSSSSCLQSDHQLDEESTTKSLQDAEELKEEGNEYFRVGDWNAALNAYTTALHRLPKKKPQNSSREATTDQTDNSETDEEDGDEAPVQPGGEGGERTVDDNETTSIDKCSQARAVLNANAGACYAKLGEHANVVKACTAALTDDPHYIKALYRRVTANELLDTWSSLTSAQEDYAQLLTLVTPGAPQARKYNDALRELKPRVEAAQKRETGEMMDKLKGLGNTILGNFGLSTDNFKFVPNGEGGYSMNFVR